MREWLIALVAVAAAALVEGLFYTLRFFGERNRDELKRRLQSLGTDGGRLNLLRRGRMSANPALEAVLRGIPLAEKLETFLEQAQVSITVASLTVYSLALGVLGFGLGLLFQGFFVGALVGALGLAVPMLIVYSIRERRSLRISEQLPDALDMMARSLRAGHALPSSFKLVASEMPTPVSIEFGHAFEEQNLGMPLDRAILQMTRRAPGNQDLRIFAVSVVVQKETGGNLVEIIEKIAETIRARYRFYGRLRALTAEGRVSAIVVGALPFVTGALASMLNPDYMSKLLTTSMGKGFLLYAIASWIVGMIWMRRMARVEL